MLFFFASEKESTFKKINSEIILGEINFNEKNLDNRIAAGTCCTRSNGRLQLAGNAKSSNFARLFNENNP